MYQKKEFQGTFSFTAHKMKFSIKDFFSKCDQIRSFLRIWSHLLKKSLMENFIFCAVLLFRNDVYQAGSDTIRTCLPIMNLWEVVKRRRNNSEKCPCFGDFFQILYPAIYSYKSFKSSKCC